jgi:hypothetical protein
MTKGGFPAWGLGVGLTTSRLKNKNVAKMYKGFGFGRITVRRIKCNRY